MAADIIKVEIFEEGGTRKFVKRTSPATSSLMLLDMAEISNLTSVLSGMADNMQASAKTWLKGAGAPAGGTGSDGNYYYDTTGAKWYGPKAGGAWPTPTVKVWNYGSGAPADTVGNDGEYYMDTANAVWIGPKAGGTWVGANFHKVIEIGVIAGDLGGP